MIPEIGHVALILALAMALAQAFFPVVGAHRGIRSWVALARPVARTHLLFLLDTKDGDARNIRHAHFRRCSAHSFLVG